jgi:hypothetical protein
VTQFVLKSGDQLEILQEINVLVQQLGLQKINAITVCSIQILAVSIHLV